MRTRIHFTDVGHVSIRQVLILLAAFPAFLSGIGALRAIVIGLFDGRLDLGGVLLLAAVAVLVVAFAAFRKSLWVPSVLYVLDRQRRAIVSPRGDAIPLTLDCNIYTNSWRTTFIQFEYTKAPYRRVRLTVNPCGSEYRNGRAVEILRRVAWRKQSPGPKSQ